jgi:flagellin
MIGLPNDGTFLPTIGAINRNTGLFAQSNERLATALRINSAKDDPAGLIASEFLSGGIVSALAKSRAIDRATFASNIEEGALNAASSMTQDLNALVVESANNAGLSDTEVGALTNAANSIVQGVQGLVNGAGSDALDGVSVQKEVGTDAMGDPVYETFTLSDIPELMESDPELAQELVDEAGAAINERRAEIGAQQLSDEAIQRASETERINLERARSQIRDTDYAKEVSEQTRAGILSKSSILVLRMSFGVSRGVLDLLA